MINLIGFTVHVHKVKLACHVVMSKLVLNKVLTCRGDQLNIYLLHGRACDIAELLHECGLMHEEKSSALIHMSATILQCCMSYHAISISLHKFAQD